MKTMDVSLIITTYNWPEALELTLRSVMLQTQMPTEVIVADDGSTSETKALLERLAMLFPVPLVHSWQEDKGFRAARNRNKALARAKGEYTILVDGDMILDRHFVEDHVANAEKGYFIQGSRVIINERKTRSILANGDTTIYAISTGIENHKNAIRSKWLSRIFTTHNGHLMGIRACNCSFWLADVLAVNGFNEEFIGWGREDSEFACRLINKGIIRKNLKFLATGFHLYHNVCSRENLPKNDELLRLAVENQLTTCTSGISLHRVERRYDQ